MDKKFFVISEEQIYKEFLRLGMEQRIAQDLSKRYYHNKLTYRDLDNLDIKFDSLKNELNAKIDSVEKNLQKDMPNLKNKICHSTQALPEEVSEDCSIIIIMLGLLLIPIVLVAIALLIIFKIP